MKMNHSQMTFYENLTAYPKKHLQNTIVEQNKLLKLLQEEPTAAKLKQKAY